MLLVTSLFQKRTTVALGFQPKSPRLILRLSNRLAVLRTIDFNDDFRRRTSEVHDEISDRHLPTEMRALCLQTFQMSPQALFSVRCIEA